MSADELSERHKQALSLWKESQDLISMGYMKVDGDNINLTEKGDALWMDELNPLFQFSKRRGEEQK